MKFDAAILCLVAFATATPASAEDPSLTGNQLLEICGASDDLAQQGFCIGYTVGVVEGMKWGVGGPMLRAGKTTEEANKMTEALLSFCVPEGATWGQYRDVVIGYLERNPQDRHGSARLLAQLALVEAFPCGAP